MPERPNIVVITTHDTGRHFGCYGIETVHTPTIDGLAADGYQFTNYFTTSPVCSPSRGAMLTGRYPQSNGLIGLTHSPWHWSFNEGERHLSHVLRDAGYHTGMIGKWHLKEEPNFDYYKVLPGQGKYFNPEFRVQGDKPWPKKRQLPSVSSAPSLRWWSWCNGNPRYVGPLWGKRQLFFKALVKIFQTTLGARHGRRKTGTE